MPGPVERKGRVWGLGAETPPGEGRECSLRPCRVEGTVPGPRGGDRKARIEEGGLKKWREKGRWKKQSWADLPTKLSPWRHSLALDAPSLSKA